MEGVSNNWGHSKALVINQMINGFKVFSDTFLSCDMTLTVINVLFYVYFV